MKSAAIISLFILACLVVIPATAARQREISINGSYDSGQPDLIILQTSDLHGAMSSNPHDEAKWLAPAIKKLRRQAAESGIPSLLIDCGDTCQGSPAASATRGEIGIKFLNEVACDIWVPGNHELDFGPKRFHELLMLSKATVLAGNLSGDHIPAKIKPWQIYEFDSRKVAIIGLTSPFLDQWFPPADMQGIKVKSLRTALEEILPELMRQKNDLIVLALHHGRFTPSRLKGENLTAILRDYPQIDLVLGGHSHQVVPGERIGRQSWYVQPGAHGEFLGRIKIFFQTEKRPLIVSELISPPAEDNARTNSVHPPILNHHGNPIRFPEPLLPNAEDALSPGPLERLVGETMLSATGADIALIPKLPVTAKFADEITEQDIFSCFPYENKLCVISVSPDQYAGIREEQNLPANRRHRHYNWPENISRRSKIRLALTNYALAGAGGRFPLLRKIADEGYIDKQVTLRDAIREKLREK